MKPAERLRLQRCYVVTFKGTVTLSPILISGGDFEGLREKDVQKLIKNAVGEQYDQYAVDRFFALQKDQRVVIIDDWHRNRYAAKGRVKLLEALKIFFGRIICFTTRLYALDELAESGVTGVIADFQFCEIKEFGKRLTGRLIEKWHALGRGEFMDVKEYHHAVAFDKQRWPRFSARVFCRHIHSF